jgi:hypothetical protein
MGAAQKVALEQTTRAVAVAAFLHNVVMGALDCSFGNGALIAPITPHYVKKLGRKITGTSHGVYALLHQ